jgi:hypothetical protein
MKGGGGKPAAAFNSGSQRRGAGHETNSTDGWRLN